MKLSVSLPEEDVEFIDNYATEHGVASRSAVVQRAVSLLRSGELGDDYAAAWDEWASSDADGWEPTTADGLSSADS
jgi:Arc/MetJ-type ribon-helix-helix transcriptional regulator